MPNHDHTTSMCNSDASAKQVGWSIFSQVNQFIRQDKAKTASRMRAEGMRHAQIARLLYGEANKTSISKVSKLLRQVA
jgi:hypothetical protein